METEIKLIASPGMLAQLRCLPVLQGAERRAALSSTYFDTLDCRLQRAGASLRIRVSGERREQTFKLASIAGAAIRRGEWNVPVDRDEPACDSFPEPACEILSGLLAGGRLVPLATTRIDRTTHEVSFGGSTIEVAYDEGLVAARRRQAELHEVELELREGHLADLVGLALELPLGPQLRWSLDSKAAQSYRLASDLPMTWARAPDVRLPQDLDAASGFQAIAWQCLKHLLANCEPVIATGDAEAIHQCRVAIRRLRALIGAFQSIVADAASPVLRAELKAAASGLGPARDLHVLIERVGAACQARGCEAQELLAHLEGLRDAAVYAARDVIASAPFQRLLLQLAGWIESGDWLAACAARGGHERLTGFAGTVLKRRRRKLKRLDRKIAGMSDAKRHRVRIEVKKLRYATGFFAALFPDTGKGSVKARFLKNLGRLQAALGELNDISIARSRHDEWFVGLDPITATKLSSELTVLLAGMEPERESLLKRAGRLLKDVKAAKAWWKPAG